MNGSPWTRLTEVFSKVKDMPDDSQRTAYLREACAGDRSLEVKVENLIHQHQRKTTFMPVPTSPEHKRFSHYEMLATLGEGGMGTTYKAVDMRLNRTVVLKVLKWWMAASPSAKERLHREARNASALNHPNIVTIYEFDSANGFDFIVMEYIPGKTLAQAISDGPMDIRRAVPYALEIANALGKAHENKIIHGDIKPSNIMVTEDDCIKLLDFGLAVAAADDPAGAGAARHHGGTPGYMAPEQAERAPDQRSDIFSFGAVLYEMLNGGPAFPLEDRAGGKVRVTDTRLSFRPGVPHSLRKIVLRCLEREPERRWQTASGLAAALTAAATKLDDPSIPQTSRKKKRPSKSRRDTRRGGSRLLWAAASLTALVLTGWGVKALVRYRDPNPSAAQVQGPDATVIPAVMGATDTEQKTYDRAVVELDRKKYEQARSLFDEVLRHNPNNYDALYNRAVCLQNLHRFDAAMSDLSRVISHNPKNVKALYNRAMCYMNLNQLKPALADLDAVIQIQPSPKAYLNRAKVRARMGDANGAADDERRAQQTGKTD